MKMTDFPHIVLYFLLALWLFSIITLARETHKGVRECVAKIRMLGSVRVLIAERFAGQFIEVRRQKALKEELAPLYREAEALGRKGKRSKTVATFLTEMSQIDGLLRAHNETYIDKCLSDNAEFFNTVLKYPLDSQQRRSIVAEEDNVLVASSAGSGKTSSIIGKVRYLLDVRKVEPARILLVTFTNKAASELTERLAIPGLRGYTFHKYALDLTTARTGMKPSVCDNSEDVLANICREFLKDSTFRSAVVKWFGTYKDTRTEEERRKAEYSEEKKGELMSFFPDMDGRPVRVRSGQELAICFALSSLGVSYRYEEPYEFETADNGHSQYKPDFSIHFMDGSRERRIYLEHFGVDREGRVPEWFGGDRMTHEEAQRHYTEGMAWKRALHRSHDTMLIETCSADFEDGDIKDRLRILLTERSVPLHELSDEYLMETILPKDGQEEKAFIRLVSTFLCLFKTSCKDINLILDEVRHKGDKRADFFIRNIAWPVFDRYMHYLSDNGKKDFTDLITTAMLISGTQNQSNFDYIIIDEFQDLSVDRYRLIQMLRKGTPPAKLYCVGDDWQSIYRFSGSDLSLFTQFEEWFGPTETYKLETTYRFGSPCIGISSGFIQKNPAQITKKIRPWKDDTKTEIGLFWYKKKTYEKLVRTLFSNIPEGKSIMLLGRYSFDDYYLSQYFPKTHRDNRCFYQICGHEAEFLTIHKSKGLEADYVFLLQCNGGGLGFPCSFNDDPVLSYVLSRGDDYPAAEERRLLYVAITRARVKTFILYDSSNPSPFLNELHQPNARSKKIMA